MRIVDYYYLAYPDSRPADPEFAATELWVDLGEEGDTFEHHRRAYRMLVLGESDI